MTKNHKASKFDFIQLAEDLGDAENEKWLVICQPVVSKSHAAGDFVITTKMLHEAVDNFKNRSTGEVPMYFEHYGSLPTEKIDPEKGAPAQGHVVDMQVRADGRLWGLCRFYEPAATYVRQKKYKFFSPGLFTDSLDRSTGKRVGMRISEVSLVGNPHLYDMPEVTLANDEREIVQTPATTVPKSLTANNVPDNNTRVTMTLEEALAKVAELEGNLRVKELELKARDAKETELELTHKAALAQEQKKLSDLQAEHEKLVADVVDADVDVAFKTYAKSHGLTDAHKPALKALRLSNREHFGLLYPPKAGAVKPAPERPAYLGTTLTNTPRQPAQEEGEEKSLTLSEHKAKLLEDNPKLSNEEATARAYALVKADAAKKGRK